MKKHIYKLVALLILTIGFVSCSVDDFEQEGKLTEDTLFKDAEITKAALNGIYSASRSTEMSIGPLARALSVSGQELLPGGFAEAEEQSFSVNNVQPAAVDAGGGVLLGFYTKSYRLLNLTNLFIIKVGKGVPGLSEADANQMLAEAKALRANAYFQLLRVFGQFYNTNSEYGVITTTEVVDGFTFLKRATVQQTYDLIISDLEFAVQYATATKPRYFVNKAYVEGLLAKVYLTKGDFANAVTYAKNVIDGLGGDFDLEASYEDIFNQGFSSKEILYSPFHVTGGVEEGDVYFSSDFTEPSDYLTDLADEQDGALDGVNDPRYDFTFGPSTDNNSSFAYNKYPTYASPYYYLRVAEVYLIYAEALARTNGDTQTALDALNKIRTRAGVPAKTYTDKATFLNDVRNEKMLELCAETGESWFDLVRYDRLGDIVAKDVKPSIVNEDKFIFPIALSTLANNPNFGPQNPGY